MKLKKNERKQREKNRLNLIRRAREEKNRLEMVINSGLW